MSYRFCSNKKCYLFNFLFKLLVIQQVASILNISFVFFDFALHTQRSSGLLFGVLLGSELGEFLSTRMERGQSRGKESEIEERRVVGRSKG